MIVLMVRKLLGEEEFEDVGWTWIRIFLGWLMNGNFI